MRSIISLRLDVMKLILCLNLITFSNCLNILVIFPYPGISHYFVFELLFKKLAQKGHNVTVISNVPQKTPIANFRDVDIGDVLPQLKEEMSIEEMAKDDTFWGIAPIILHSSKITCNATYKSKNLQAFLKENNTFDIILMEHFCTNCFNGFLHKYKAPFIILNTLFLLPSHETYFGVTDTLYSTRTEYLDKYEIGFMKSVELFFFNVYKDLYIRSLISTYDNEISMKYMGVDLYKDGDIMYNASLMLMNTFPAISFARALPPNIIEIGGIHIDDNNININKIPEHIKKWIDDADHGVIYFSFGTMLKGSTLPEKIRTEFIKAFKNLPQRILWKWENDSMPDKPDNVMVQKWTPQLEILCHHNVRAFISHGGLLSVNEAVHCGVPVILMPQYGDQFYNSRGLVRSGGGVMLDISEAKEETIINAVKTVLSPEFNRKVRELSERFKDRPMSAMDTAIYWVEYIAKHKGAPHLKSVTLNMPFYEYYFLDVILLFLFVFFVLLFCIFRVVRLCLRKHNKVKLN